MSRLLTLQMARGLAANLVILSHLVEVEAKFINGGGILPAFCGYGIAGVDLFFVLSGMIMVAVAGKGVGSLEFLWRRAARIYPAYWLVSLVVLAASLLKPEWVNAAVRQPISIWRSFLLVPGPTVPLLAVGWTLVHEVYFYLVFALILALRIPFLLGLICWGLVLSIVTLLVGQYVVHFPIGFVWTNPLTIEFMMGAAIGLLYESKRIYAPAWVCFVGLLTLVISIVFLAPAVELATNPHFFGLRTALFGIPMAMIVYGLAGMEQASMMRVPQILVTLGDWSYGTYLLHVLIIVALGRTIHAIAPSGVFSNVVLIFGGLLAANLAGALSFNYFERPTLRLLHKYGLLVFGQPKHAVVSQNAAATSPSTTSLSPL
jgi:exopolysaccharide production protein ExoZ